MKTIRRMRNAKYYTDESKYDNKVEYAIVNIRRDYATGIPYLHKK